MNDNLETYVDFLKKTLIYSGAVTFGRGQELADQFRSVASKEPKWTSAVIPAYNTYAKSKNYSAALSMVHDSLLKMFAAENGQSLASTNVAACLPPIGREIYRALKNNRATVKDDDKRTWHGITELDCEIFNDGKLRTSLWQTEEHYTKSGMIERREVRKCALASENGSKGLELVVLR